MTSWNTREVTPDVFFIEQGNLIVGSINQIAGRFVVEIMWSAPGGDIRGDFPEYLQALAFIQGVEAALHRRGQLRRHA